MFILSRPKASGVAARTTDDTEGDTIERAVAIDSSVPGLGTEIARTSAPRIGAQNGDSAFADSSLSSSSRTRPYFIPYFSRPPAMLSTRASAVPS